VVSYCVQVHFNCFPAETTSTGKGGNGRNSGEIKSASCLISQHAHQEKPLPVSTVEATTTPQKLKGVHGGKLDKENGGDPPQ
jgi:hypothetical protein